MLSCGHKETGLRYLWLALASVVMALLLAAAMRVQLAHGAGAVSDPRYGTLTLLHGSLMVFFVLTSAPQLGFGYFFLPLQIGANDMALPLLSGLSFWLTLVSWLMMAGSFLLEPRSGMACWLFAAACFSFAAILSSVNFCATVTDSRTAGMTLGRLPLTVWGWYVTAVLSLLIFAILLAVCTLLAADWLFGTGFFAAEAFRSAPPAAVWQRWFWFFTQAEAYVAMLPCFGLVSHLLSTFSRRPVCAERAAVLALCAVGLCGFCVWGFHMFASALDPYTPLEFGLLAASLGIPASVLLASWLGTLWSPEVRLTTAMLFALGFVSLFLTGGLSGLLLARHGELAGPSGNDLVTGHFHLVMGVSATFAILAGLFFWFPKLFGRRLDETLGKLHFWLTFAGVYCVFVPMHWLGLLDRARSLGRSAAPGYAAAGAARGFITAAAMLTIAAQLIFLGNFLRTVLRRGPATCRNPWHATTLEWFLPSPVPAGDFGATPPSVYRSAYMYGVPLGGLDFIPQHISPERLAEFEDRLR